VLIDFHAGNTRQIDGIAGMQHAFREASDLLIGHALVEHGHQERGHLVIGDLAASISLD